MTSIEQIKQHALDNYNNGWDYIVECYTDEEIQQEYLDVCDGDVTKAMALIQEVADYRKEQSEEARRETEANTDTEKETPMTDTIADRINKLMTFYAAYSKETDRVFDVPEEEKDDVRYKRDLYARWVHEELAEFRALGINVEGFDYMLK